MRPVGSTARMRGPSSAPANWACKYCNWISWAGMGHCDDCDAPAPLPPPRQEHPALSQLSANVALGAQPPSPNGMGTLDEYPMETEALPPPLVLPFSPGVQGSTPEPSLAPVAALVSPETQIQPRGQDPGPGWRQSRAAKSARRRRSTRAARGARGSRSRRAATAGSPRAARAAPRAAAAAAARWPASGHAACRTRRAGRGRR